MCLTACRKFDDNRYNSVIFRQVFVLPNILSGIYPFHSIHAKFYSGASNETLHTKNYSRVTNTIFFFQLHNKVVNVYKEVLGMEPIKITGFLSLVSPVISLLAFENISEKYPTTDSEFCFLATSIESPIGSFVLMRFACSTGSTLPSNGFPHGQLMSFM